MKENINISKFLTHQILMFKEDLSNLSVLLESNQRNDIIILNKFFELFNKYNSNSILIKMYINYAQVIENDFLINGYLF